MKMASTNNTCTKIQQRQDRRSISMTPRNPSTPGSKTHSM